MNPRKPNALRILEGNRGKRPLHQEPTFEPVDGSVFPRGLIGRARKYWADYAAVLSGHGVLTDADLQNLRLLCEALATRDEVRRERQRLTRRTYREEHGYYGEILHERESALDVQERHWTQLARLLMSDLGVTPTSRGRVAIMAEKEPVTKLRALTGGHGA